MGETTVNFGVLSGGASGIMQVHGKMNDALENLEGQLAPMVASWTGDAREAYFQQKKRWDDASASMAQILAQMGNAVQVAESNYRTAENANLGRWG